MTRFQFSSGSALLATAAAVALAACGGGGDSAPAAAAPQALGTLQVALTDAPACGFDEVVVTVERVRVHQSEGASENDVGWRDIEMTAPSPREINLLDFQNAELADLGQTELPPGRYTQMRLVLAANNGNDLANYVIPSGTTTREPIALDTPSAQRSGIKLIHGFTVEADKTVSLVLDFDACHSVVQRGNGSYALKPVISVMPMTLTRIVGYVETGVRGVQVTAQKDGVVYKATHPKPSGQFVLGPIPSTGPYDVVFSGKDLTTSVIAGVPVTAEQTTTLNDSGNPVLMPTSPSGTVSGKVTPLDAADGGVVRAFQTVGGGPIVQVARAKTDMTTGEYSLRLPTAPPRLASYSSPPLAFAEQAGSAAKYELEASAPGFATPAGLAVTVDSSVPQTGKDFMLVKVP